MTLTVNTWFAWAVAALALVGACTILYLASGVLERLGGWWQDRRQPLTDEDGMCPECARDLAVEQHQIGCPRWGFRDDDQDGDTEGLPPLPPVRSAAELGFTGPQPAIPPEARQAAFIVGDLGAHRERWAPAWEAEARGAYQALGLDYPSGLLARVRELTP